MSLLPTINDIAKASVLVDEQDLPGLVSMHGLLRAAQSDAAAGDLSAVTECIEHAAELIERIVHREAEDAAAALELVRRGIEYAQRVVAADQEGRPLGEAGPSPFEERVSTARAGSAVDSELLASWVVECGHTLAELESQVMAADSSSASAESLAEVRRRLHTIKGECGVLSLHIAQRLCHEAESCIDRCIGDGMPLPASALLSLIDWMRLYTASLGQDCGSVPPDHLAVLAQFAAQGEDAGQPDAAASVPEGDAPSVPAVCAGGPALEAVAAPVPGSGDPTPVDLRADGDMKDNLNDFLCESREHIANSEQALLELEKNPRDKELINTVFRAFHTIKGVAGFMNLGPIVSLAHSAEFLLDSARNDKVALNSQYLSIILKTCDLLGQMIRVFEGGPPPTNGQVNAQIDQLERAVKGETPVGSGGAAPAAPAAGPVNPGPAPAFGRTIKEAQAPEQPAPTAPTAPTAASAKRADQTVKVSTGRMDMLVDMVGELVIAQQMVVQDPAVRGLHEQRLQRNLTMVGKIIRDLQAVSMSLRMVPVKATFQKMARLVRDVSAKAGKHIVLHTEGEDVELDRNVVEEIADPLVHMIRNSCDHGIEPGDARKAAGKPETGNVHLRAFHSGGSIVIEIEDDGKGLDRNRIIGKAVEKGIYTPDRPVAEIPDSEVFNLIFLPGFSTAEKVTDLSGRGVGMDVVRRNIEALRGKIDIRSTAGKGTTFSMRLPLTMAIIDGMVVRVGGQRYVIPTLSIERSFRPQPKDIQSVVGKGEMAVVRGSLLPIYRLNRILGHDTETDGDLMIVVESQDTRACLAADEIIGQQQVVIKALGQASQSIRGVSGGAILGDGRVALILDIGGILSEATCVPA